MKSQKGLIEYVLRYTGRPVMAESRIEHVDHVNRLITHTYEPHEDDQLPDEEKTVQSQSLKTSMSSLKSSSCIFLNPSLK
jgi:hypothetical protein